MNRNIQSQIMPERGVNIRMPSTALLGVSSADRNGTNIARFLEPTTPFDILLTSKQNFLSGFFTRIALTEVRIPWYLETLTNRNNRIVLQYFPAVGAPVTTTLTLVSGWYTATTLAAELQRVIRLPVVNGGANLPNFTVTYSATQYKFTATAVDAGAEFTFQPFPQAGSPFGLLEMMNWRNNFVAPTQISGVPTMLSTEFVDIVSTNLTYAQDVKDGDTEKARDVVARIYLAKDGVDVDSVALGSAPFVVYRQFQTPKQIKWDSNLPIGQLAFQVYDDRGMLLSGQVPNADPLTISPYDGALGEWSITLLVSEV
jgi:hypothetical protein